MILHLTLKKKWFDMILSGNKNEEYRVLNLYWFTRLVDCDKDEREYLFHSCEKNIRFKKFDYIHFYNGNAASLKYPNFIIECKGVSIKKTVPEWSDNYKSECFAISLGRIINANNIKQ